MQNATDGVNGVVYQGHLNRIKAHNMAESWTGMVSNFNWVYNAGANNENPLFNNECEVLLGKQFNSAMTCMCSHVSTYSRFPSDWILYPQMWQKWRRKFVACSTLVHWFRSEHLKTDTRKREQKKKDIKSFNIYWKRRKHWVTSSYSCALWVRGLGSEHWPVEMEPMQRLIFKKRETWSGRDPTTVKPDRIETRIIGSKMWLSWRNPNKEHLRWQQLDAPPIQEQLRSKPP